MSQPRSVLQIYDLHYGWFRPSRSDPWQLLTEGRSWRECYLSLREMTRGCGGEVLVLRLGRVPSGKTTADAIPPRPARDGKAEHHEG